MTSFFTHAHCRLAAYSCLLLAGAFSCRAVDLKIDINQRSATNNVPAFTEGGFTPMVITSAATGAIAAATVNSVTVGAQTVSIKGTGAATYDDRKRAAPVNSGTFNQQSLLQDFIFGIYSAANPDAGLDITITGLTAGKEYLITLWSFDSTSTGTRVSNWTVNGNIGASGYTFSGGSAPTTNTQYQINFQGTADGSGQMVISGRRDTTSLDVNNAASHGVFLNALWVRDLFLDTDGDLMPDGWEEARGLDKDVNDAALDPDNDQLNNLKEYEADTNPLDPDSDDDTLIDGYENKSGIWVSAVNTGTSPLIADTDGDGLSDALENPGLPWTGPAQPGTDPNKYDSDGDGFSDGEEVAWPTHPRDNTLFPHPGAGGTLAVDFENTTAFPQPGFQTILGPGTTAGITSVGGTFGPYNVTVTAVGSTTIESRDRAAAAGGMGFNPMFRDFIFSPTSNDDGDGMDVVITGLLPLTTYPVTLWAWDPTSSGTARHSTWLASDGDNAPVVKVPVYSLAGATLPTTASDRRMQFDAKTDSTGKLTIQGRKEAGYTASTINVFLNAFVIGAPVATGPKIVITELGPATPFGLTFTWTSQDDATYKVEASGDLETWETLSDTVDGLPDFTSYTDMTAPTGSVRRYYRVSRKP